MTQGDNKTAITLRAHHLLCMHGFRGLGYDDHFVENMARVCERVRNEPDLKIIIVDGPDEICEHCPHVHGCICEKEGEDAEACAKELDRRVLDKLGIQVGQTFARDEIFVLIYEKIAPEDLAVVCEGCDWLPFDYCAEGLRKKQLGSKPIE